MKKISIAIFMLVMLLGSQITVTVLATNLKGKDLSVQTEIAIACFSTGWLEKVRTCSRIGNWLKECKNGRLENELFEPISSTDSDPRCIKLQKGDKVNVIEVDSKDSSLLWIEIENRKYKWWTFKQFFETSN